MISLRRMVPPLAALSAILLPLSLSALTATPAQAATGFVEERVYVETTVDTDGNGRPDRVAIDISRPAGSEKVPSIFEHSPYRKGLNDVPNYGVDVNKLPQDSARRPGVAGSPQGQRLVRKPDLTGWIDDYFAPQGYATISGQSIGTGDSDGCPTTGDMNETLGATAVIDWLNGRARGFNSSGGEVKADWSTGKVGMTGISYNGTLPNMAATTGVDGLKAIVPVSAIADWYDYYRANGLVVAPGGFQGEDADVLAKAVVRKGACASQLGKLTAAQDRVTGDHTDFWKARDYVGKADKVKAAVFIVHGQADWNVKGKHYAAWLAALRRNNVEHRIWLHKGGHGPANRPDYQQGIQAWFDHYLKGIDNGVDRLPKAEVQYGDGTWKKFADWPDPAATDVTLHLGSTNATDPGTLTSSAVPTAVAQSFVDEGRTKTAGALAATPGKAASNRLVYLTAPLKAATSLSGTTRVTLRAAVDNRTAANLTAVLVDYNNGSPKLITRGWMDPQNHAGLDTSSPVTPGKEYDLTFDLQPMDYVFGAGHQIGLLVISTDYDYTLRPAAGTKLHLAPAASSITLPLANYAG